MWAVVQQAGQLPPGFVAVAVSQDQMGLTTTLHPRLRARAGVVHTIPLESLEVGKESPSCRPLSESRPRLLQVPRCGLHIDARVYEIEPFSRSNLRAVRRGGY